VKKKETQKKLIRKWKLSVAPNLRLIIDGTTILALATTSYIGIFKKDILFMVITVSIILSYIIFIYKGLYDMRVEMKNKNITLISFPFARISIPYKKIKSMEIVDRRWNDYLMGYGCKLKKINEHVEIYFRSRMKGKVVIMKLKNFKKIKKVEMTIDRADDFTEDLKRRVRK